MIELVRCVTTRLAQVAEDIGTASVVIGDWSKTHEVTRRHCCVVGTAGLAGRALCAKLSNDAYNVFVVHDPFSAHAVAPG